MWELRVEGRLIDDPADKGAANSTVPPGQQNSAGGGGSRSGQKRKFSSFFKSLVIELDKDIYGPDNHLVEWHRTPTTNETDGFQVRNFVLILEFNLFRICSNARKRSFDMDCLG